MNKHEIQTIRENQIKIGCPETHSVFQTTFAQAPALQNSKPSINHPWNPER